MPLMKARAASYVMFAALIVAVCVFRLGPVLLAGLFSYMILDLTYNRVRRYTPRLVAKWLSVAIFVVAAAALSWTFAEFVRRGVSRMPAILESLVPAINSLAISHGIDLPFDNLQELRNMAMQAMMDKSQSITKTSGLLTRGFFQILIGIFVAVLKFLSFDGPWAPRDTLAGDLGYEFSGRAGAFMSSCEKVLGAQVVISLINTSVTACYLAFAGLPYFNFLTIATFVLGCIPLVGNVTSNTLIVGTALTVSPKLALWSLIFLVLSHKAEYFLNSRIIGSSIKTPMWMTLLGLLVGEVVMGVPGLILAPALLHYIREELAAFPAEPAR